jgi:hypothetical protein
MSQASTLFTNISSKLRLFVSTAELRLLCFVHRIVVRCHSTMRNLSVAVEARISKTALSAVARVIAPKAK